MAGTSATVFSVTGGASSYDVTISGGNLATLNGTVTLLFDGGQNIQDLFATALTNTTPTGTNNNTFLMQQDTESPSVEILNAPATVTNQDPFSVTFEFSEDVTGFAVGDITVGNGNASNFGTTDASTYTADITPTGAGDLTIDINAGVAQDAASNPNTAATQVRVSCGPGCGEDATIAHTQRVLQNYTGKRIRHITAQGPELSGLLKKADRRGGNGFPNTPFDLNYKGTKGYFSTGLRQVAKSNRNLNLSSNGIQVKNPNPSATNVWIKGRWAKTSDDRDDIDDESDFGIIYLGADYHFSNDLLIGLLGQYDWFDESSQGFGSKVEGKGWMIGPYLVSRLKDNLTMDVRVAWGQSDNKINPIGSYWDSYDSERWQIESNLTGSFQEGNWHVVSNLGLNYFKETQESYIDSNGFTIPEQSTVLGTLSFGPKITYMAKGYDGLRVHPFMTVKGIWDFKAPDIYDVNGIASGTEELRAQVGFGMSIFTSQGTNVQTSYTYDGIGIDDYESHSADLSAIVSLEDNGFPKGSNLRASYSLQNVLMLQTEASQAGKVELSIPFN
ncbi:MAG: autotransporter outer membrane beta-barrel domain-containing protein [Gammaproteobacteria bacterium]|nr:autotransporter outer membrane beta-barrel domain-containing protein [Gammaproteobacteria bacterium]